MALMGGGTLLVVGILGFDALVCHVIRFVGKFSSQTGSWSVVSSPPGCGVGGSGCVAREASARTIKIHW